MSREKVNKSKEINKRGESRARENWENKIVQKSKDTAGT